MARYRDRAIDDSLQFLMDEARDERGAAVHCKTLTDASNLTGISTQLLSKYANNGIHRLDVFVKVAKKFGVDIELAQEWISNRIQDLWDEGELMEQAS